MRDGKSDHHLHCVRDKEMMASSQVNLWIQPSPEHYYASKPNQTKQLKILRNSIYLLIEMGLLTILMPSSSTVDLKRF